MQKITKNILFSVLMSFIFSCQKTQMQFTAAFAADVKSENSKYLTPNTVIAEARQLTFTGPRSGEGYFSADGKKMIFQSEREQGNPFYQMYVMDLGNGKTTRLSPGQGKTTCGWIHPDLKHALWSSTHQDKSLSKKVQDEIESRKQTVKQKYSWSFDDEFEIYSSDLQGKNRQQLTKTKGYDAEASYSPDGKWIAFASNRRGYSDKLSDEDQKIFQQDPSYMMDIYIMKADGSQVKQLTDVRGYDGGPFFSADGKKITWRRFSANGTTAEIYTMNTDGTDQKPLTHLNAMSWAPYFHPSGDYLIFGSNLMGFSNFELFIVDAEGKKDPVRVSFLDGFDGLASFSPDGNTVTWTHRNEKGESQIMLSQWDDAQARQLLGLAPRVLNKSNLSKNLSEQNFKTIIYNLASEQNQGRSTGSEQELRYTKEILNLLNSFGVSDVQMDPFEFTSEIQPGPKNSLAVIRGSERKDYKLNQDFQVMSFSETGNFVAAPVVFAGYGIKAPAFEKIPEYNSYAGTDVKGKWVLLLADLPFDATPEMRQHLSIYSRLQHKVTVAKNEGALGILIFDPYTNKFTSASATQFEGNLGKTSMAVLRISADLFKSLMKIQGDFNTDELKKLAKGDFIAPRSLESFYVTAEVSLTKLKKTGYNVIARIASSNPKAKALLIGAHGDHLGLGRLGSSLAKGDEQGRIHYGADDNASGVSVVLELAQYFSQLENKKKLQRDLYFAIWSGEEIGLLGSNHFVEKTSKIKEKILANINLDMVGRLQSRLQVQGVGSSKNWKGLLEELTIKTGLPLNAQEDPHLPTDSMSFYMAQIPAISLFTGAHEEYHTPRDRAELINYSGLVKIASFAKEMVATLAYTRLDQLPYEKVESANKKLEGRSFRIFLGTIPDYTQEGVKGVRISGTSKSSPAEKAGLVEKDVIIEFDGKNIENIYDYVYGLQSVAPNKETTIKVKRGSSVVSLKIVPTLKE